MKIKEFKSIKGKIIGLIGQKKAFPVLIKTRFGIHTFFLKFPIDVLILDKDNKTVKIKKNLKPNRIFLWNPKFNRIIELPEGEIEKKKIKTGNVIEID